VNEPLALQLLADCRREFANQRDLAERAIAQLADAEFFRTLDPEANSVATIVKHIGGNLRSRWTDFLTTDGEKPDRNRDGEFVTNAETRAAITRLWESGWAALDASLQALEPPDLLASVRIRGQPMTVIQAINRSLAHTAQHVGQIILLAKHLRAAGWKTLSIPRAGPAQFVPPPLG
jgi:hypothetical protein